MWKTRSTLIFISSALVAGFVLFEMMLSFFHDLFGWKLPLQFFQYCINLLSGNAGWHYSIELLCLFLILFTFWQLIRGIIKQVVLIRKFFREISMIENPNLTFKLNTEFFPQKPRIIVVNENRPLAYTIGLLHPKIILSTEILKMLENDEVKAVVYHEMHHLKSLDPMKTFILSLIKDLFWYIPITHAFYDQYRLISELSADHYATKQMNSNMELGSALLKLLKRGGVDVSTIGIPFVNSTIDYRIEQLLNPQNQVQVPFFWRGKSSITSMIVFVFFLGILLGGCN